MTMVRYMVLDRCPNCHKGKVFQQTNLFTYKKNYMNKCCPDCHYDFQNEPGFYWGAMYASYALGVAECFITYLLCQLLGIGMFDWTNLYIIILALLLLSPFNFRMSRIIWLYIFS